MHFMQNLPEIERNFSTDVSGVISFYHKNIFCKKIDDLPFRQRHVTLIRAIRGGRIEEN